MSFFRYLLPAFLLPACFAQGVTVLSPDQKLAFKVTVPTSGPNAGWAIYEVTREGKPVIAASRLGLDLEGQPVLGEGVQLGTPRIGRMDDSWTAPHGKASTIQNRCTTMEVELSDTGRLGRKFVLEARVFDDGLGFRYKVPQQPTLRDVRIEREMTQFQFAAEGRTFSLPLNSYKTSYEDSYLKLPLTSIKSTSLIGLPFLAEVPGVAWVGVTEAHLENYAGLYLARTNGRTMEARLSPRLDDPTLAVIAASPIQSPWRVLLISERVGGPVESNIVMNLNPPSRVADTSWIKPGKTSWSWWSGDMAENVPFKPGMNTDTMKYYVDFSASAGLDYMLIDEGWSASIDGRSRDLTKTNPALNMPAILEYAKAKGVGIWVWAYWSYVDLQMDEAFPLFEKWGIRGVKIDFMDRDDQDMVAFYHRVAKKAAEHHLLIDWHGAYKPTGISRYYPNVLTFEAVMGLEYLKWSARSTSEHNTVIPFTRMLAGPLDYTPGGFRNVKWGDFRPKNILPVVPTTRAHQTALYVVLESAFQMLADDPDAYKGAKELDFLKQVPVTWDETRVVAGMPGEYVVIARRKGADWYLGAITGWESREIDVPMSFLGSGSYQGTIYVDSSQPDQTTVSTGTYSGSSTLKLKLSPSGGAAIRFTAAR